MSKVCAICKENTIFYIWNTSANLDKSKIPFHIKEYSPYVVCLHCFHELDLSKDITKLEYPEEDDYKATPGVYGEASVSPPRKKRRYNSLISDTAEYDPDTDQYDW